MHFFNMQQVPIIATLLKKSVLFIILKLIVQQINCSPIEAEQTNLMEKLEAPISMGAINPYSAGPGIDLVGLNLRRFELNHKHQDSSNSEGELRRSELIESKIAAIPERFLNNLPEDVNKQIFESLSTDPTLMMGPGTMLIDNLNSNAKINGDSSDDPDGASIERLTKSCLTVHASSAKAEQLNVTFHLYTKFNQFQPFIMKPQISRQELINNSPFNPRKPIKWITHGFHTNVDKSEWMLETKDKILFNEDANVILTDWRRGASPALAFYPKAAANAHVVAKLIVKILRRLRNDVDLSKIHLIGHSLGAHIMGFVGSAFTEEYLHQQQQLMMLKSSLNSNNDNNNQFWQFELGNNINQLIGRITACDPALPCFGPTSSSPANHQQQQQQQQQQKLNIDKMNDQQSISGAQSAVFDWTPTLWTHLRPDSAVIVEVMHSNPGVMGYSEPLGDFDFYPNGFERQPGCGTQQNQQHHQQSTSEAGGEATTPEKSSFLYQQQQQQSRFSPIVTQLPPPLNPYMMMVSPSSFRSRRQLMSGFINSLIGGSSSSTTSSSQRDSSSGQKQSGGGSGIGISHTFDRFIKPIRDFFHGYTCSHHRSVEYMVESMYYDRIPQDRKLDKDFVCQMVGYRCSDYVSFKKGHCFKCLSDKDCRAFTMPVPTININRNMQSNLDQMNFNLNLPPQISLRTTTATTISSLFPQRILPLPFLSSARSMKTPPSLPMNSSSYNNKNMPIYDQLEKFRVRLNIIKPEPNNNSSQFENSIEINNNKSNVKQLAKRVLPTFNHFNQNYLPQRRSQYYFDTKPSKDFCLHHYHFYIKYRWFRVRDSVKLDGFKLIGTIANITALNSQLTATQSQSQSPPPAPQLTTTTTARTIDQETASTILSFSNQQQTSSSSTPLVLNKFTYQSYTMLLTEPIFLGQIEALLVIGDKIKSSLVEFIEITYMSNLDPKIRSLGSARLCKSINNNNSINDKLSIVKSMLVQQEILHLNLDKLELSLFVRCSGVMV